MKRYRCLIIEDEPLAQKIIQKHIASFPQLQLDGSCENALKAFELLSKSSIDLLFLDITLPEVSGIDLIRSLKNPPAVIFTTAYSEYAVTSYEFDAVDYLLKPITFERFSQAMNRFFQRFGNGSSHQTPSFLTVKESGRLVKIPLLDILYIEARKDYLLITTVHQRILTYSTMKAMEEALPSEIFIRIHRSYIVSMKAVEIIAPSYISVAGIQLPIGETYRQTIASIYRSHV